jgi:putative ABC transport system permease protein
MLLHHIRYAVRALIKRPGFAGVAVATLALGVGANAAIFTVVNAVLLRPLPYRDPGRLVRLRGSSIGTRQPGNLSPMDFVDLQTRQRTFDAIAAYNNFAAATLTGAGDAERLAGTRITASFFTVLGVAPRLGRDFRPDDDLPGAASVVILTDGFWRRRFGADPGLVGRSIQLSGVASEVIGVLPPSFAHPFPESARQPDIFVLFKIDRAENNRGGHYLQAIGRLRNGVSIAHARADLTGIAADLERAYPASNTGRTVTLEAMLDSMIGAAHQPLLLLAGTVAFVLLIACVNLANLMLARSASRRKELALRQAIGASRADLMAQLMTESAALAFAGGALGLLVASWTMRALAAIGADRIPRGSAIHVDGRVLLFTGAVSCLAAILFGVGPALYATRENGETALREGGRSSEGRLHTRAQQMLIVSEIALALMLLVGAGLLVKSFLRLETVDPGFRAEHVLTLQASLPLARYPEGDEMPFYQQLEDRLRTLAGVGSVGAVNILPLGGNYSCDGFDVEGRPSAIGQQPCAEARSATPGYFAAMGIPLLRGRLFTRDDTERSRPVLVVSEKMAHTFLAGGDPIGARIIRSGVAREVVGIVGDVKHFGLDRDVMPEMYTPHAQQPSYHTMNIVVRTWIEPQSLTPAIRRELAALDRDVPLSNIKTMEQVVADTTTEPRFRTVLMSAFAAVALLLSVIGVGGVIAYMVGRRTQEIGVRVALGATRAQILALLLKQGMVPAVIGLALGVAGAGASTRLLSGLLFGVDAADPAVFAMATGALCAAAFVATYLPARRATAIDPSVALRAE